MSPCLLLAECTFAGGVITGTLPNGPNLGRLGRRQPEIYGTTTYAELVRMCEEWGSASGLDVEVRYAGDDDRSSVR